MNVSKCSALPTENDTIVCDFNVTIHPFTLPISDLWPEGVLTV